MFILFSDVTITLLKASLGELLSLLEFVKYETLAYFSFAIVQSG